MMGDPQRYLTNKIRNFNAESARKSMGTFITGNKPKSTVRGAGVFFLNVKYTPHSESCEKEPGLSKKYIDNILVIYLYTFYSLCQSSW
jgi:hypothetical protein